MLSKCKDLLLKDFKQRQNMSFRFLDDPMNAL